MLLQRSVVFALILILLIRLVRSQSDYSEFYTSPVAIAIKYIGENGSPYGAASAAVAKRILGTSAGIKSNEATNTDDNDDREPKPTKSSYSSYEVPGKTLSSHKYEKNFEDELDALDKEYSVPTTYKLDNVKKDTEESDESEKSEKTDIRDSSEKPKYPNDYPATANSGQKIQPIPTKTKNYQNYNFQPNNNKYPKTPKPFIPSYGKYVKATNSQPVLIQNIQSSSTSNCEEVDKPESEKNVAMKCIICKDPKTGAKSEQCSYNSAPQPKSYYHSKSAKFTQPHKGENPRYKRYAPYEKNLKEDYMDPYEFAKSESQKHFSKPEEYGSDHYNKDFYEEYKFPSDYFGGESIIKSESEAQAAKMMEEGGTCEEVKKDGMNCKVCKNEKTGGNYEQCSYSSEPKEKKYAYVRERKYDGDGKPIEDKVVESSEPKPVVKESDEKQSTYTENKQEKPAKKAYEVPEHFIESNAKNQKLGTKGLDPELYGSEDVSHDSQRIHEDYSKKTFPKYESEAQKSGDDYKYQGYKSEDNKKDVEKVLEEFAKKDRSSCQKAKKNEMTCFLCVNKDGTKHEECMYVSDGQPQASHVAYHELEEYKNKGKPEQATASSSQTVSFQKRKRPFKKVSSELPNTQTSASEKVQTQVKFIPNSTGGKIRNPRKLRRNKNYSGSEPVVAESKTHEVRVMPESEPSVETPEEFTVGDTEGAYSSETKPIYSKSLGVTLPKYMLDKSEFEDNFNKFSTY